MHPFVINAHWMGLLDRVSEPWWIFDEELFKAKIKNRELASNELSIIKNLHSAFASVFSNKCIFY